MFLPPGGQGKKGPDRDLIDGGKVMRRRAMEQGDDILLTLGRWQGKQDGWQYHQCAQDRRADQCADGLASLSLQQQVIAMQAKDEQQTQQMDIRQTEQQKVIEDQLVPGPR